MVSEFVPHPKYGDKPRYTGLDPDPDSPGVFLHWNTNIFSAAVRRERDKLYHKLGMSPSDLLTYIGEVIKGTAVVADVTRQSPATVQVTHYYDIKKVCRTCSRHFIFFAEEQKYWYEELGFPLEADCVRCAPCRKKLQQVRTTQRRYEKLVTIREPSPAEEAETAECRLTLVEEGIFHSKQLELVRSFLNRHEGDPLFEDVRIRLQKLAGKH